MAFLFELFYLKNSSISLKMLLLNLKLKKTVQSVESSRIFIENLT